jgi:hypothetical protein
MKEGATLKTFIDNMSGEKKDLLKFPQITPNKLTDKIDHINAVSDLSKNFKFSIDGIKIKILYQKFNKIKKTQKNYGLKNTDL